MGRKTKVWTALGVAMLAGAAAGEAAMLKPVPGTQLPLVLVDGEGGEGGGDAPTTYAIGSTDANAFAYDASEQVKAYANLVFESYAAAKSAADGLSATINAFLDKPSEESLAAARKAWVEARPPYLLTETFRFYDGPIEAIEGEINAWPMNEAYICLLYTSDAADE